MFKSIKYFLGGKRKKIRVVQSQYAKPLPKSRFEIAMDAASDDMVMPRKRAKLLLDVYPLLSQPCFKYSSIEDTEWAMEYMLELWNSVLNMMNAHGDSLLSSLRMAAMKCITAIMKRNEYRLESLGFNDTTLTIDKSLEKICKRYCSLLAKTLIFATKRMNEIETRATDLGSDRCIGRGLLYNEDYTQGEMYFYAETLAISYFRIPGIAARLITRVREILLYKSPELLQIDGKDSWKTTPSDNEASPPNRAESKSTDKADGKDPNSKKDRKSIKSRTISIGFRYFMPAAMNIAFTANNGRVINKNTSVMTKISLQTDEELENTKFVETNPSLFFWKFICNNDDYAGEIDTCFDGTESLWLDKFSVSGYFFSSFVHAWINHIKALVIPPEQGDKNFRLIRFTTIPGFVIILKLFLSLLRDRYLNELDTIKRRSATTMKENCNSAPKGSGDGQNNAGGDGERNELDMEALLFDRYIVDTPRAVVMLRDASKELLKICPYLFNFWIAIALEHTSLHFPPCVEICFSDIGEWLECLEQLSNSSDTNYTSNGQVGGAASSNGQGKSRASDPQVNIVSDQKNYQQILPSLIKTNLLPKALTILTNAEHHRQLLCALRFIYKQKPMMNRLQYNMCYDLFDKHFLRYNVFFKFFLHWDYVVRIYFFHLLVYRLFSVPRQEMRLESDMKIVKNLMEVVLSRKRRRTPEDDLNSSFNARVARTIDDFLSRVLRFIENPGGGSISLPEDRTVYCKDAYGQYVKVVEEYYRRAIETSDGVVSGPSDIMLMEDDEN